MKYNEEQAEAIQQELDLKRSKMIKTLPLEESKKYEVVDECVRKLTEAGIPFWFFPELSVVDNGKERKTYFQWNNISTVHKDLIDKDGAILGKQLLFYDTLVFTFIKNEDMLASFKAYLDFRFHEDKLS
jgi:hypothetical protein